MPDYADMTLEELVTVAQRLWLENNNLRGLVHDVLLARNNTVFHDYIEPYGFWVDWEIRARKSLDSEA